MKNIWKVFVCYIKQNIAAISIVFICYGIFLMVFSLYSLPLEAIAYGVLLTFVFIFTVWVADFISFYNKHNILQKLKKNIVFADFALPSTGNLIEKDYQELITIIDKNRMQIINKKDNDFIDMIEYYTVWVHQIKTPIAAMRLLLQSEPAKIYNELLEQLFKIEQYAEMVLQYLRTENMNNDLMLKMYSLDDIVKQAVRKYAKLFIYKKIKLNYRNLNCFILTDEKWLIFVIEQILSNCLKYTISGCVSIYMDKQLPKTLVIEDTGIGIEQEALPRVFEKGFTGYNGRMNKTSTGIGLYLCKKILNKLSHTIMIESEVGKGTKVKIGFDTVNIFSE